MRSNHWRRFAALAITMLALVTTAAVASAAVPYEFVPGAQTFTESGKGANLAGGHPDVSLSFKLQTDPTIGTGRAAQAPRTSTVILPEGLVGDTGATVTCPLEDAVANEVAKTTGRCPRGAAVGIAIIDATYPNGNTMPLMRRRLWRVGTGPNEVAAFATSVISAPVRISVSVSPSDGYRVRATADNLSQSVFVRSFDVTLWGVPPDHQGQGSECDGFLLGGTVFCLDFKPATDPTGNPVMRFGGPLGSTRRAFMTNPSTCGPSLDANLRLVPYGTVYQPIETTMSAGTLTGCESQPFEPSMDVTPATQEAGQPSGYTVGIDVPQNMDPDGVATAQVKDVSVTLPQGVAISPPSANGLDACSDAQFELKGDAPVACPDASKLGTLRIETPVLEEPVSGFAYLGSQLSNDPMSGEMYRLFLVAKTNGVLVKLQGQVKADPVTGQLTTSFRDNPQLPFERIELRLDGGQRASLVTPPCGTHTASAQLTSWSGKTRQVSSTFAIDKGCASGLFSPAFKAGSVDPTAAGSSPFLLSLTRADGEEQVSSIRKIQLPPGLLGHVGDVALCGGPEADAGNCPASSRLGKVEAAAGSGLSPLWVPQAGKSPTSVSLTGPYRGAPYGLSIVVPAQAGPFDLGKIVVRSALHVDERTTQLTTGVDQSRIYLPDGSVSQVLEGQMPTVLGGIPLNVRELRVIVDRQGFMVNPTDCSPKQVSAQAVSVGGKSADLSTRYTAANCAALGFSPRISLRVLGKTNRNAKPRLRAVLKAKPGEANIGQARVNLPHSLFLEQSHIRTVCTRVQWNQGQGNGTECPAGSIYGKATAVTPLLDKPLEGPVYLRSSSNKLPDLVAALRGPVDIELAGRIDSGSNQGLRTTFEGVPDAPVSKFVLEMKGGKKGLLVNSRNLCAGANRAIVQLDGQNGKAHDFRPAVGNSCGKAKKKRAGKHRSR
jgi:hypothetical protein